MSNPYPGTSVSGYNASPPPDDGSQIATNEITWAGIKTKLGDPLNTFASSVDSNLTSAFTKLFEGSAVVSTGVSYAAGASDQGKLIKATVSGITITTPDAGTVGAPFVFSINNQSTGQITLAGNATGSQTVDGQTSQIIQAGGSCMVKTDGTNWYTVGLKSGALSLAGNNYGFVPAVNLQLKASVGSNLLTVAVKTKAGNDPSAGDPVLIPFRDATLANGDPVWLTLTSALSINTNATGATLASQNSTPFRFWVVMFNNGGTPVLALWHSGAGASAVSINPLNEATLQSSTAISAAATSAGVFYTPNGTTVSGCAFRILGYIEYTTGLTTAGTYASAPNIVQLFGPGVYKPGDVVQSIYQSTSGTTSINSTSIVATNLANTITPTSPANPVRASANGYASSAGANNVTVAFQLFRGLGATAIGTGTAFKGNSTVAVWGQVSCRAFDQPFSASSVQYGLYGKLNTGTSANTFLDSTSPLGNVGDMLLEEIMG